MKARELDLETLRLEQEGRVLTAYYSSPPLNFVTTAFLAGLDQLTRAVDRDSSVGAVVLGSAVEGRFLTHADAGELGAMAELPLPELPSAAVLPFWKVVNRAIGLPGGAPAAQRVGPMGIGLLWGHRWKKTILRMNRSGVVYLAAMSGPTLGGGHEIALACDLRYAADDPRVVLGQIEILAGIIPGGGGTQRLSDGSRPLGREHAGQGDEDRAHAAAGSPAPVLAEAVLPLIRTPAATSGAGERANDHGRQMHEAIDLHEAAIPTTDPAEVHAVTRKAPASTRRPRATASHQSRTHPGA